MRCSTGLNRWPRKKRRKAHPCSGNESSRLSPAQFDPRPRIKTIPERTPPEGPLRLAPGQDRPARHRRRAGDPRGVRIWTAEPRGQRNALPAGESGGEVEGCGSVGRPATTSGFGVEFPDVHEGSQEFKISEFAIEGGRSWGDCWRYGWGDVGMGDWWSDSRRLFHHSTTPTLPSYRGAKSCAIEGGH
jgi:hypothetical protein